MFTVKYYIDIELEIEGLLRFLQNLNIGEFTLLNKT